MNKNILVIFLMFSSVVYAKRDKDLFGNYTPSSMPVVVKAQVPLEANNIRAFFWNTGIFDQDLRTNNTPGFEWPKNSGKFAIFTAGLSIAAFYQGSLRAAMGSYNGEYAPGYCENGQFLTDSRFKIYSVKSGDNQFNNPDWANWGLMVPFGAPFVDVDNNGSYDPAVDIPGIKDAAQTIFVCVTDADPSNHTASEGFGGGTAPLGVEVRVTGWAYNVSGLTDLQFVQFVVINKSGVQWDRTHMSIVVDPDLGDATDDYIGCDTTLNLGFCYNADNVDGSGGGVSYGVNPPASGMDYFLSPIVPSSNPNDSVVIYHPPGSDKRIVKYGYRELGTTSFVYFTNTGSGGPQCENDPSSAEQAYFFMRGLKKDGTPWVNIQTNQPTVYCYPGDPETGTGWTEYTGRITNCGGSLTGGQEVPAPPGDRRFIFNSGSNDFTFLPGDTQYVVLGKLVARGSDNKNSVTLLKQLSLIAQRVFDLNFKVIPPPPPPTVNVSYSTSPSLAPGTTEITLSWDDAAEFYSFNDVLFNTGLYKFQGYEVYEIRKDLENLPDIQSPTANKDGIALLRIFDRKDTIGAILDSLKIGSYNQQEQYCWCPVVPAYGLPSPPGFPNTGLSRRLTIKSTFFPSVNGGSTNFIYGNKYKFAVIAYAYNPNGLAGGKVIRNAISSVIFEVTPEAPPAGTSFSYINNDTLFTNRRDLGVMPIIVGQEKVVNATYRIVFNSPDTTYNILKSIDNGQTFSILKANLKYTNLSGPNNTVADDSSRVYDGILFKVQRLRYVSGTPSGNYTGNFGVVKDPTLSRDSIQTRQRGWDYFPSENIPYEGSKYAPSGRLWQSRSMSLSYPNRNTYIGVRSALNPEDVKKVKIVFTGYGNGQQAYRYLAVNATTYQYQDMREVPFKVYEIDFDDNTPTERQVNCAFLEFPDGAQDNKWEPTNDTLGGKDILYIFNSDYNPNPQPPYITVNLFTQQMTVDVMYVWSARAKTSGATFKVNDQMIIYNYTVTRPGVYYEFSTQQPIFGSTQIAKDNNALSKIKVVPNPYYGYNNLETQTSGRFVTFRNLPVNCTIKIYTLNGDLIRTITKNDNSSTATWGLNNLNDIPVASGIYIALIDAPGIGTRALKIAVFTPEERIDF